MRASYDRNAIYDWVIQYFEEHGRRPTQVEVAANFGMHQSTVSNIMGELELSHFLPGEPRGGRRSQQLLGKRKLVLEFITDYMDKNVWAPSRREIAEGTGIPLSDANVTVAQLAAMGLIEVGNASRQIRLVPR
jgi:DNA-binding IclR family transcriptional regulator